MTNEQAQAVLAEVFAPLAVEQFLAAIGRSWFALKGNADHPRARLFGSDPRDTMLSGGYRSHPEKLDFHSPAPSGAAPVLRQAADAADFQSIIGEFHERGYTVRIPDVVELAPALQRFVRALEVIIRQPVKASIFWSAAGARAIVHYDKPHNIIVQLTGKKRWFISTDPPGLQNKWAQVGEAPPDLQRHQVLDVDPGDLIYIPGGTPHTVESTAESLHLAIVFDPVTLREAIIAAIDLLSDSDRSFREVVLGRAEGLDPGRLAETIMPALDRLRELSRSPEFIAAAMELRASRATADLPPLARPMAPVTVNNDTRVRHTPLAIGHLRHAGSSLDFAVPGEHIAIHPGVEPELRYIASNEAFRVGELPGAAAGDVKIALVSRLIQSGFLEVDG